MGLPRGIEDMSENEWQYKVNQKPQCDWGPILTIPDEPLIWQFVQLYDFVPRFIPRQIPEKTHGLPQENKGAVCTNRACAFQDDAPEMVRYVGMSLCSGKMVFAHRLSVMSLSAPYMETCQRFSAYLGVAVGHVILEREDCTDAEDEEASGPSSGGVEVSTGAYGLFLSFSIKSAFFAPVLQSLSAVEADTFSEQLA